MSELEERSFKDIARNWKQTHPKPANDGSVRSFGGFVKQIGRRSQKGKSLTSIIGPRPEGRPVPTYPLARKGKYTIKLEK